MSDASDATDLEILRHRVQELPDHITYHSKRGFSILHDVDKDVFHNFLEVYLQSIERGELVDGALAQDKLKIDKRLVSDAVLATSLATSAVADLQISADSFIDLATGKIFAPEHSEIARYVVSEALGRREGLKAAIQRSSLTNAVLPAFQALSAEIDLRVRFNDDMSILDSAPVAILGLRKDVGEDTFFQMDRDDVNRIVKQMTDLLSKLDAAANLLRNS
jgi:hypothetical protein